jgi:anti-sigma B factor antagonist
LVSDNTLALAVHDEWDGGLATVTVHGEVDITTLGLLTDFLGSVADRRPRRVIIDLAAVDFIDSAGLHAIVSIWHAVPAACPVVLRSPHRQVRRMLELTGLSAVLAIES